MSNRTVILRDQTFTVLDTPVAVGDTAKDVTLTDGMTTPFRLLGDTAGHTRLLSVTPSRNTGISELQTHRMNVKDVPAMPQCPADEAAFAALKAV